MKHGTRAGFAIGLVLTVLGCAVPVASADTLYVNGTTGNDAWDGRCETWDGGTCGPKATIQAGIDTAIAGDVVIVADGVYTGVGNRDLTFAGKDLTLRSANGPESCIIDCAGLGRGFYFANGETSAAVVEGFTVRYGQPQPDDNNRGGGAILCLASSPTIRQCVLTRNRSSRGGAVYAAESTLTLARCTMTRNNAPSGGGVYLGHCQATIRDCVISANDARSGGGVNGAEIHGTTFEDCLISDNTAGNFWPEYSGNGGMLIQGDDVIIRRCKVAGNVATGSFGGIACTGQRILIDDCDIIGNHAGDTAGGVGRYYTGEFTIRSSRIVGNTAVYDSALSGAAAVLSCLIADNVASEGAAITGENTLLRNCTIMGNGPTYAIATKSNVAIENCIIWGNHPSCGSPINGSAAITYSVVEAGWPGLGNLDVDPGFRSGGVHLRADSPCRNAGNPAGDYNVETDLDGEPRVADGAVDIGCDEFTDADGDTLPDWWEIQQFGGPLAGDAMGDQDGDLRLNAAEYELGTNPWFPCQAYHVDPIGGDDAWDGRTPAWDGQHGPKATIQAAVDLTDPAEGDVVTLTPGTYRGPGNRDIDFHGKLLTLRAAVPGACTLDCEGRGRAVYLNSGESDRATLEGLTIRNGVSATEGGGVYVGADTSATIRGCTIEDCTAPSGSGAWFGGRGRAVRCDFLHNYGGRGLDMNCGMVEDCTFVGHVGGGGLDTDGWVRSCVFLNNSATNGGGYSGSGTLFDCLFQGNTASEYGGAVSGARLLSGCTLRDNYATLGAGGWHRGGDSMADVVAESSDFLGNTTPGIGGGVLIYIDGPGLKMTGCRLVGNSAGNGSAAVLGHLWRSSAGADADGRSSGSASVIVGPATKDANSLVLENCIVAGNRATRTGSCTLRTHYDVALTISASTIAQNAASMSGATGHIASVTVTDSIIRDTLNGLWGGDTAVPPDISYSNVVGGWTGEGNIDVDPLLVDPDGPDNDPNTWADNDYRLAAGSPCIDAGSNAAVPAGVLFDLDGLHRITDGNGDGVAVVDMGAYERPATVVGDVNCDGVVDFGDINPFVLALINPAQYAVEHPGCPTLFADCSGDGAISFADINPFIDLLLGR